MEAFVTFALAFSALAAPRLALDAPSVDFGEVAANAALVREVRVGNAGDAPFRVSRVKACCGAKASLAGAEIPAGTSSVLRVEFNPGATPRITIPKLRPLKPGEPPYFLRMEFAVTPEAVVNEHCPKY